MVTRLCLMSAIVALWMAVVGMPALSAPQTGPPVFPEAADEHFTKYTLKAGTPFHILLQSPVSTAENRINDPVDAILTQNIYLNETLLFAKNTRFRGYVTRLEPPLQGRDAILEVRFTDILLSNGERLPISAHVRTEHPEHIWGGKLTDGTKPVRIINRVHGIGEYSRIMFRGPRAMGSHIRLDPGDHWTIVLEQPLTIVQPATLETTDGN